MITGGGFRICQKLDDMTPQFMGQIEVLKFLRSHSFEVKNLPGKEKI